MAADARREFECRTEYLLSYSVGLQAPELIGPVPEGVRATFYLLGGEVRGPRMNGRVRPVGADWFTMRRDGVGVLDVRGTIETAEGALIEFSYNGLGDLGADGYERMLRGELPPKLPLRTTPRFRSADPAYEWLHRLICIGVGEVDFVRSEVSYDVYALR